MVDKLSDAVKAATQAAVAEIKSASTVLTESSTQIAATATSYRDILKSTTANPPPPAPSLDARVRAREGIKARQLLVDTLTPGQKLHQSASNTQLVSKANEALRAASAECPSSHRFVGVRRLNNGGLLLEMDSEEAASWLSHPTNRADFLGRFAPDAALKSRTYSLVVQFVPLQFRPDSERELRDIEETNMLPNNAILRARWLKPAYRRAPDQTCGHILAVMTKPEDANTILTNGLVICQKRVYAVKCKKEPTRCLKCHGWGHMSYDCQQPFDICGTCADRHRTTACNNRDRPRCVSCKAEGHTSWSRRCPVFLNKCLEMDARMTENQMPYYPTTEPWTHTLRPPKPAPPAPRPAQPQYQTQAQPRDTGTIRTAIGAQRQTYKQSTLSFPHVQAAPRQGNEPGATSPTRPPPPAQNELPANDANGTPTGHARPWGDDEESAFEGPSALFPV